MNPQIYEEQTIHQLEQKARKIRLDIVEVATSLGTEYRSHPGPALSITDIMCVLYYQVASFCPHNPQWPDRDRIILSKGHACLVYYCILADLGFFEESHLKTFRHIGSILQGHPDMTKTPGVDATTGSLGNGLGVGVGFALGARMDKRNYHTYVVLGDGESQEGVLWEAAQVAVKYKLGNLTAVLDINNLQSCGKVEEIMPGQKNEERWKGFGWRTIAINGHDMGEILSAYHQAKKYQDQPTIILAHTIKGKGISYMENNNDWHQAAPSHEQLTIARQELS